MGEKRMHGASKTYVFLEICNISLEKNLRVLLALLLHMRNTLGALNRERLCIKVRENLLLQRLMRTGAQSPVIKHGGPLLATVQKPGVDQDLQVVTESALAQVKNNAQFRDAKGVLRQYAKDAQTQIVPGCPEEAPQWRNALLVSKVNNLRGAFHRRADYQHGALLSKYFDGSGSY